MSDAPISTPAPVGPTPAPPTSAQRKVLKGPTPTPGSGKTGRKSAKDSILGATPPIPRKQTRSVSQSLALAQGNAAIEAPTEDVDQEMEAPEDDTPSYNDIENRFAILAAGQETRPVVVETQAPPNPAPAPGQQQPVHALQMHEATGAATGALPLPVQSSMQLGPGTSGIDEDLVADTNALRNRLRAERTQRQEAKKKMLAEADPAATPPAPATITTTHPQLHVPPGTPHHPQAAHHLHVPPTPAAASSHGTPGPEGSEGARLLERRAGIHQLAPDTINLPTVSQTAPTIHHGTYPLIHPANPLAAQEHTDPAQLREWGNTPGYKLAAVPFDLVPLHPQAVGKIANDIRATLNEAFGCDNIQVSAPAVAPFLGGHIKYGMRACLLWGLTKAQYDQVLEKRIWSTRRVTIEVSLLNPPLPNLIMAMEGLTTEDVEVARNAVLAVWDSDTTYEALVGLQEDFLAKNETPFTADQISAFIDSMTVSRLDSKTSGGTVYPRFHIFANSSLLVDDSHWIAIRKLFHGLSYPAGNYGTGIRIKFVSCSLCHGADHPRGMCPFPDLPGWRGPRHATAPWETYHWATGGLQDAHRKGEHRQNRPRPDDTQTYGRYDDYDRPSREKQGYRSARGNRGRGGQSSRGNRGRRGGRDYDNYTYY
ncbi:hypothetical protein DENSPDRAFT_855580 [Dentipellis sp. KUC8613]|nr:hypothetical protein DENSPDRAFT_855580 [Dentipellis sp. KUC8613]